MVELGQATLCKKHRFQQGCSNCEVPITLMASGNRVHDPDDKNAIKDKNNLDSPVKKSLCIILPVI